MRKSFVFYSSFYEAIQELPTKKAKLALFTAIAEYALTGQLPNLQGIEKALFILIKPQLDVNNERYENSLKGGRPKKTNGFQNEKPNENVNENVNDNVNVVVNESASPSDTAGDTSCTESPHSEITFDDNDKKIHNISQELFSYWQKRFPSLDLQRQLGFAESWLACHPAQSKGDLTPFLVNWFIRNHERSTQTPVNTYDKLDGNSCGVVSDEERSNFDGF